MKISNELKTGVVVAAAIAVAAVFYIKTTDFSGGVYKIKTYFSYAEGVKPNSIVKLSGIDVGRVESISFNYAPDTKVEIVMAIDKKAKVREDSITYISQSGLIGDAYIGITAGSSDKQFVKDGAILINEEPVEMRKLMRRADAIAENLDKTLVEVKSLAANVNGVVSDSAPKIAGIVANLEETSGNFKDFSSDIKQHPWKLLSKK